MRGSVSLVTCFTRMYVFNSVCPLTEDGSTSIDGFMDRRHRELDPHVSFAKPRLFNTDGKNFQPSTICRRQSGRKIDPFTYGLTTFVGKKFIDSCALGSRQIAAKLHHSAARNKTYKAIPSLLLPRPPRGRHTSLPPTLPRLSSVQKMRYAGLNFVLQVRETETKN